MRSNPIVITQAKLERGLGHAVSVLVLGLEFDLIGLSGLYIPEEPEVDDGPCVDGLGNSTVREGVTMDLASHN